MPAQSIHVSHVGYLCLARKVAVISCPISKQFEVQNMAIIANTPLGAQEAFQTIYRGDIEHIRTPLGDYGLCDFSGVIEPGIYRVVLTDTQTVSYQFTIADGAFSRLPFMFLDFIHELRSGYFSTDLRGPTHLDDGIRSDSGEPWDASGGWYDAGDTRKWMAHSTLPALAFFEVVQRLGLRRTCYDTELIWQSDWLAEAAWGIGLIFKMQSPQTGMIFEDVGGGSTARRQEGMSWWYANHAGCYADNADNRWTDNQPNSGDERSVRVQYNPIAQYVNIAISARAYSVYVNHHPLYAERCYQSQIRAWSFCHQRLNDAEHLWTVTRAWRTYAAVERYVACGGSLEEVESAIELLLENYDTALAFWRQSAIDDDPYRAILHSGQPIIALTMYIEQCPKGKWTQRAKDVLHDCYERYIRPLSQTNPYQFIPFGLYRTPASEGELYRPWRDGLFYRYCMPANHPQRVNHGLSGHWMSWAYALACMADALGNTAFSDLAWAQIYWLMGNNDHDVTMVSGIGYNNLMPHSRFLGTIPGGFCNGFRGTIEDIPYVDMERRAEWNSTEYWNVPLSNCLMALARLLPRHISNRAKLGYRFGY